MASELPRFQMSIDAQVILNKLLASSVGETIAYDDLSALLGRDVRSVKWALETARRRALSEHQMLFEAVRNVGVKRCSDSEKVRAGMAQLPRARSAMRSGVKKLASIEDYDQLSKDDKVRHNTYLSLLGTMLHISKPNAIKEVESKVEEAHGQIPLAKTLELFKK